APRGSAPAWPGAVPEVPDLRWSDTPAVSEDAGSYYFLQAPGAPHAAEPIPAPADDHEIFDVNAIRADFPILRETVNGKPLIWFDNAATTQKPQVFSARCPYSYAQETPTIPRA